MKLPMVIALAALLLLAGCKGGDATPQDGAGAKDSPPKPAENRPKLKDNEAAGWLRGLDDKTGQVTLEAADGSPRKYEKTAKGHMDFHSDPEGRVRGSFDDIYNEFVVLTLEKQ